MRTFVLYDEKGKVQATMRLPDLPEGLDHPFGEIPKERSVIEVEAEDVGLVELDRDFKVDVRSKELVRAEKKKTPRTKKTARTAKKTTRRKR